MLAVRLGLNLSEIPSILGISKAMLFAYRNGSNNVSNKALTKLEEAERQAGIKNTEKDSVGESSANPKDGVIPKADEYSSMLREDPASYGSQRRIPVIGWAHAGSAESYDEIPRSWQNQIPTDCPDSKAFAVSLEGDSMEPKFSDGDILVVQPSYEFHSGCYVVARFADDGVIFRRLEMRGGKIILVPLNPQYKSSEHRREEFSWIYPVWCRITKLWRK